VLFTMPNLETAGSGRAMLNVIQHLDPERYVASVCVGRSGGALEQEIRDAGIEVIVQRLSVDAGHRASLPKRVRAAAAPMKGRGFDVWHSFHYLDDYTEPIVARLAGAKGWVYTKKNMSWNHRSWWLRTALASGVAVQNTDMLRDFFGGRILGRRARYVPRGVPVERWALDPEAGGRLRAELGIPDRAPVVACVAQVLPRKNQLVLVEAAASVPGLHVLLAGRENHPEYVAQVRAAVERDGTGDRVHWLGQVSPVTGVLSAADLFCLPTGEDAEGCPVALLEAMACGMACIATAVPGSKDVVQSGRSGLLVPAGDVPALRTALADLVADPQARARMGAAAHERIASQFSIELEARRHEALYDEVLGSAQRWA
jgi:glycosyltransferase involved in cell wall biosynthesis